MSKRRPIEDVWYFKKTGRWPEGERSQQRACSPSLPWWVKGWTRRGHVELEKTGTVSARVLLGLIMAKARRYGQTVGAVKENDPSSATRGEAGEQP